MPSEHSNEENLIWDPTFPSLKAYSKKFDYDLRGRKVRQPAQFFENPQSHIELWVREHQTQIIAIGAGVTMFLMLVLVLKAFVIESIKNGLNSLRFVLAARSVSRRYKKMMKNANEDERVDADIFAAEAYRKMVAAGGIYKYKGPTDIIEYESGRYNWEALRETGLAHEELLKQEKTEKEKMAARVPGLFNIFSNGLRLPKRQVERFYRPRK